jgi:hypothetical protein
VSRLCGRVRRRASPGLDTDLSGLGLGFIYPGNVRRKGSFKPCPLRLTVQYRRLPTPDIRQDQRLVNSKVPACATNEFGHEIWVNEHETVAEGVPLTNHRVNRYGAERKREVQLHDLAEWGFNWQHGSDPGFANVHGTTLQLTGSARSDRDINLKLEPGACGGRRQLSEGK